MKERYDKETIDIIWKTGMEERTVFDHKVFIFDTDRSDRRNSWNIFTNTKRDMYIRMIVDRSETRFVWYSCFTENETVLHIKKLTVK